MLFGRSNSSFPKREYSAASFLFTNTSIIGQCPWRRHPFPASSIVSYRRDMDFPDDKKGKIEVAYPPDDSLEEIFFRLPAKPLFRFKCVSKDWCGLIADRLRCRKFPQTLHGFFVGDGVEDYGAFIDLPERPVPLVDPSFSFLTKLPEIETIVLLGSSNGLVLFGHMQDSERCHTLGYIVCNPATEEWVSVPRPSYTNFPWEQDDSDDEDYQGDGLGIETYLIFDPAISPHFWLIQLRVGYMFKLSEMHTFSSVTGAWRLELHVPNHAIVDVGACLFNGMLHIEAEDLYENKHMILAIHGEERRFRTLHWLEEDRGFLVFVGQSQGHLHCLSGFLTNDSEMTMTELSIWVLEDYNAEKWVLRDNVSISKLFGRISIPFKLEWDVVAIHPDRSLIFFAWNRKLISYNMDKKEVCDICSLHGYHRPIIPYVPYFAQSSALAKKG